MTTKLPFLKPLAIAVAATIASGALIATVFWRGESPASSSDTHIETTELTVPFEPHPDSTYRSAWITYWDDGTGLKSLRANAKQLTVIHPFWYETRSATDIAVQGNATFRNAVLQVARDNGLKVIPTITETLKTPEFIAMAGNKPTRTQHVDALCKVAKDNNFDGLDIDYEMFALNVNAENVEPARQAFSALISELSRCLHEANKTLEVTVLPKTDNSEYAPYLTSLAPGVFDYRVIGEFADVVRPMAYDHTTPLTQPGSTDPVEWVRAVGHYTRKHIPARKVVLGLALYGYDWKPGSAKAITARQAPITAARNNSEIKFDPVSKSRHFEYTDSDGLLHTVWFNTSADTKERVQLAKELQVAGVSFWAIGSEATDFWQ